MTTKTELDNLLDNLKKLYPKIIFVNSDYFMWSPRLNTIKYHKNAPLPDGAWSLIHEVAHADLNHITYHNDIQLLQMEVQAWERAKKIAKSLDILINEDHIQDCLDTYRDWLHLRSTCPTCQTVSFQHRDGHYGCFNCSTKWKVPESPVCKIRRTVTS